MILDSVAHRCGVRLVPDRDTDGYVGHADIVLNDSAGYARKHYSVGDELPAAVIIRPDGYIGGICKTPAGVKKYYSKIYRHNF